MGSEPMHFVVRRGVRSTALRLLGGGEIAQALDQLLPKRTAPGRFLARGPESVNQIPPCVGKEKDIPFIVPYEATVPAKRAKPCVPSFLGLQ
jgi:hypothetical protein